MAHILKGDLNYKLDYRIVRETEESTFFHFFMLIHLNDQLLVWEASPNCSVVEAMIRQLFAPTWVPTVILKSAEHPKQGNTWQRLLPFSFFSLIKSAHLSPASFSPLSY